MGIGKTPLGTMSVVSGLDVNGTDGIAIRTAIIPPTPNCCFCSSFTYPVPLSGDVSDDMSWYLVLKYDC